MPTRTRLLALIGALAILASACGSTSEPSPPRLVVIDNTGNISIIDGETGGRTRITTNAAAQLSFFQPVWSPDGGRIVYSEATPDGARLIIVGSDGEFEKRIETPVASFFHQWNPTGERIAFLGNGASGLEFHISDVSEGTTTKLGDGSPFYFDWSPTGDQLITQVGRETLSIRDLDGSVETLPDIPGEMQAPQWTEEGRWYMRGNDLILDAGSDRREVATIDGFATFTVAEGRIAIQGTSTSPDGTSVLYQPARVALGPGLHVVDIETGDSELVEPDPVLGFWWSPDGSKLAYLTLDDLSTVEGSWHVWDGSGVTVEFPAGVPSLQFFRDLAPFFDQYTRSMTVWSPDSQALVHPMALDGVAGVWVLPLDGGEPERITDGVWASWNR